ncbi:CCA tRNA nucleotidyltransferase [Pelagibius litoralis]|uniref:CCA tRNA nucleotidyltransferase n=1 Tax=Pelagibius litoralis TaxID=374515 RepID=A0A967F253_9PROT|nr:CCA tRNA nucleotidyltransferase [Pelagibius litoralis]NIA71648.1 CCA tRNA nucleotidyltransferase [Pelagibius litoralis]
MFQPQRLELQDWMIAPESRRVMAALAAGGSEVRFVGGCVRDALAGRPVKDVDIATPDEPVVVMALLRDAGIKVVPTGLDHGTVTAVAGHKPFEITTLREDLETDGRRAKVAFTDDWLADASRRDLTFNALSCTAEGQLFDPFDGRADLEAGRVRFVGDAKARIQEDYLRLLRFFRFQAHYGRIPPEEGVLAVMSALAPQLKTLSGERLRQEFLKLLAAEDPLPVLWVMKDHAILDAFLPEIVDLDVLSRLLAIDSIAVDSTGSAEPILRLAALLPPDRDAAVAVARRLRLSGIDSETLRRLAAPAQDLEQARLALDPLAERPAIRAALRGALYRHGAACVKDDLLMQTARRQASSEVLQSALAEVAAWRPRTFPLSGSDVLALGIPAGPQVGGLLRQVEDWWTAADFAPDRAACLAELHRRHAEVS